MSSGVRISIRDLEVRYPGTRRPVLQGLDLKLPAGGTLAVVGESGSGKSVLVRALLGLAPVTSGAVFLEDLNITRARGARLRAVRRGIGTVFQSPVDSLDPRWSARRSVAEALALRDSGAISAQMDAAGALLAEVDIPAARHDALPAALSGGECQRVAIARAVAGDPDLVLADEPTAMLDPETASRVLRLLAKLQRNRGFTLVFITHHIRELELLPGALLVLCAGRVAEATAAPIKAPAHPFSRYLWAAAEGPVDPVELADAGCPFQPGCPRAEAACAAAYPASVEIEDGWTIWCHNPE